MVMHVIKKCPNCNVIMETGQDEVGIGVPFKICKHCNSNVIDKNFTEWELKNSNQKLGYFFIMTWTSFFLGLLLPILVIGAYEEGFSSYKVGGGMMFILWLVGAVLVALKSIYNLKLNIQESNNRMKDQHYRSTLKDLGLL